MTPTPIEIVTIQDVLDAFGQNINPLSIENLKKILHQTTLEAQLCTNLVLVSVEEIQKFVDDITKEKVNPKEPPSHIQIAMSGQTQELHQLRLTPQL